MSPTLAQLDAQWPRLARSHAARRALIRWANDDSLFAGMRDLADVLSARRDPAIAHDLELALASRAHSDDLAARTLLQMLLPGLVRLKATVGRTDPDATHEFVVRAWERIRTYPSSRRGSVAANVVLDVRKSYVKHRIGRGEIVTATVPEGAATDPLPEEHLFAVEALENLVAAARADLVSEDALATLLRTRFGTTTLAEIAAEQNVDRQVVSHRRWRAENRLRDLPLVA